MNDEIDNTVWRVFDDSAIVRAVEGVSRRFRAAANSSLAIARAREWWPQLARWPGQAIAAAAITHIALMLIVARPSGWQWLILPGIALAIGAVLIDSSRGQANR